MTRSGPGSEFSIQRSRNRFLYPTVRNNEYDKPVCNTVCKSESETYKGFAASFPAVSKKCYMFLEMEMNTL